MLFVYLYSDILPFFHRDIYVINAFVCTYWLKTTRHCRVDMQFELFFSIYFYKWHVCITCCVMGRIWIMRQICVILVCHEYGHVWVEESLSLMTLMQVKHTKVCSVLQTRWQTTHRPRCGSLTLFSNRFHRKRR